MEANDYAESDYRLPLLDWLITGALLWVCFAVSLATEVFPDRWIYLIKVGIR